MNDSSWQQQHTTFPWQYRKKHKTVTTLQKEQMMSTMCKQRWLHWFSVMSMIALIMLVNPRTAFAALPFGCTVSERGTYFADVTGDGKADAIVVNTESITVRPSNGSYFLPNESWTFDPYYGDISIYFADVTGDGAADAIALNTTGIWVRPAEEIRVFQYPATPWTSDAFFGNMNTYFADVTGDGMADAIAVDVDKVWVRHSTGNSFATKTLWTNDRTFGDRGTFFVEVTGDGRADAITVNNDKVWVRRSNGSSFDAVQAWTSGAFYGDQGTYFAEVMGDSAHAIAVNNDRIWVSQSLYTRFDSPMPWTNNPYFGHIGTYFADVTGDGLADAIVVNTSNVTVRRSTGSLLTGFTGNESWTTNPYYGDAYPRCSLTPL